jgi:4-amino-4-deoxy-L-arabinose transferase-like glycosyltransferase
VGVRTPTPEPALTAHIASGALPARAALERPLVQVRWAIPAAILVLILVAAGPRLAGLNAPDGRLHKDEALQALAADGVLHNGLPAWPTGRISTRGLVNSYLMAPSFALLGRHDFSARLPSALAGILLVPLVFLFGRAVSGTTAGLAAASFVALSGPLVEWSRNAWPPSIFLLLFTLSAYCGYRGFVGRRGGWQIAAAATFCLALLSYELAVLLPGGVGLYLGLQFAQRRWDWYRGRPTLLAFAVLLGGVALFGLLALAFRLGTLAGPASLEAYVLPGRLDNSVGFYLGELTAEYTPLLLAGLLGLPLLARARPRGTAYLLGLLGLAFFVPALVLQNKQQVRYLLPAYPLLAVLAAAATVRLAGRLSRAGRLERWRPLLGVGGLVVVFGLSLRSDFAAAVDRLRAPTPGPTWLQSLQAEGIEPSDLLLTEGPDIVYFYLGRADFYFYRGPFERYSYRASDAIRLLSTNSAYIREHADFRRLVEAANPGRTLWVLGRADIMQQWSATVDRDLWRSFAGSADRLIETPDGWALLKLRLPRRVAQ